MKIKMLCLTVMLALVVSGAYARGLFDSEANFQWELSEDGNSVVITGYTGTGTDILDTTAHTGPAGYRHWGLRL